VTGGSEAATPQAQLLVDATARAVEGELLVARLRARARRRRPSRCGADRRDALRGPAAPESATLRVLGRDRGLLEVTGPAARRSPSSPDGTPRSCCCSPFTARDCRPTG
jgi:hypothetical protein